MANSSSLLAALALLVLVATAAATDDRPALHHVSRLSVDPCQIATYPELCQGLVKTAGNINTHMDLEVAAIKEAMAKVNEGVDAANMAFTETSATDSERKTYIDSCKGYYSSAVSNLQTALDHLNGNGSGSDINLSLSTALTNIDTCSSDWEDSGMPDFPFRNQDGLLKNLISNALSYSKALAGATNQA